MMLRLSLLAALLLTAYCAPAVAAPSADPLARPADLSPRSLHLLMNGVAADGDRLVAVGERGIVLVSGDRGASWRQVPAPVSTTLSAVAVSAPGTIWAAGNGGVLLVSQDRGDNWAKVLDGRSAAELELDQAKAALAGAPDDAARQHRVHEAELLVSDGPDKPFLALRFLDRTHGLLVGAYGLAFATEDGGAHWVSIMDRIDNPSGRHLYGIAAVPGAVVLVGEQGSVFRSTDGGQHFVQAAPAGRGTLFGVVASPSGALIAYGLRGALYRSTDAGISWRRITRSPASINGGLVLADGSVALVDEAGLVARSTDDGASFTDLVPAEPMPLAALAQADAGALILAGAQGTSRFSLPQGAAR